MALGHPNGRQRRVAGHHRRNRLHATGGRYALDSMCIDVGQGIAVVVERV